ncbi:hypothetical protein Trydic_g6014 [Trypoxylus dichotomus]
MMGSRYQDVAPSPSSLGWNSPELPITQSIFGSGEFPLTEWECRLLLRHDGTHSSLQLLGPPVARVSGVPNEPGCVEGTSQHSVLEYLTSDAVAFCSGHPHCHCVGQHWSQHSLVQQGLAGGIQFASTVHQRSEDPGF